MKQVLILTDQYPPYFAPRIAAVAKYLPRYGSEPTVVTAVTETTNRNGHRFDSDSFTDYCPTYRLFLGNRSNRRKHYTAFLGELLNESHDKAFEQAVRRLSLPKPDIILCFAYRKFPLRTAASLSKHWGIPFLADCRDIVEQYPPGDFLPHPLPLPGIFARPLATAMAHRIIRTRNKYLRRAAAVCTVSPWHQTLLSRVNPATRLIYNGYDHEVFQPSHPKTDRFRIVFTGRLVSMAMRDPSLLFDALSGDRLRPIIRQGLLSVDWYVDDYSRDLLNPLIARYALADLNRFRPMVAPDKLPAILSNAAILLQLAAPERPKGPHGYVTTKLFESLAMEKPILLVRNDHSVIEEILQRAGCGCPADDRRAVEDYILDCYRTWEAQGFVRQAGQADYVASFSRCEQVATFAELLNQAYYAHRHPTPVIPPVR